VIPKPFTALHTPRLVVRPVQPADAPAHFAYASDPEVARHVRWDAFTALAQSEAWAQEGAASAAAGHLRPLGIALAHGPLIGHLALHWSGPEKHILELGYVLGRAHWGQGYAVEAASALLGWALRERGVLRLQARCFTENPASARVLEKLGFVREGLLRGRGIKAGQLVDQYVYGLVATDAAARSLAGR
jgi:[ribosomal protein S5]-alanine N-acetyltransferase